MALSLLDTDILSEVLKQKNGAVVQRATAFLRQHGQFTFSAFTRYEVLRGLKQLTASAQLARFAVFCAQSQVIPIDDPILDRASDLWAEARRGGRSANDADLVIAATALVHGLVLVTGNAQHFAWIAGLTLEDWR